MPRGIPNKKEEELNDDAPETPTSKRIGPPRKNLCCEWCGKVLFTAVVHINTEMLQVRTCELQAVDENVKKKNHSAGQRPCCPYCDKITDLCLE